VVVRGEAEINENKKGDFQIVVTSIPYRVNKSDLLQKIADLVHEKKLEGIKDVRDESTRDIRVVIELKSSANAQMVLNYLYKHTQLEETFHYNVVALVDGVPQTLSLKAILESFVKHRKHGCAWYQDAHRFARGLSRTTGLDFPRVVGVIAALSPRCAWSENVTAALTLVRTGRLPKGTPVLPLNVTKAREIIAGKPPLEVLRGSKVLAFYDNILSPKTSQHVTIDIHAARAAFNKPDTL
jgi:hypothetical protein